MRSIHSVHSSLPLPHSKISTSGSQTQAIVASDIFRDVRQQSISITDIRRLIELMPQSLGYTWEGSDRQPVWFVDSLGQKVPLPIELLPNLQVREMCSSSYLSERLRFRLVKIFCVSISRVRGRNTYMSFGATHDRLIYTASQQFRARSRNL